jgi:hypothetical protein
MEPKERAELASRIGKPRTPATVLDRTSRGLKISSSMIASNDWLLDHRALLRWADDGGRWAEESNVSIREVTI